VGAETVLEARRGAPAELGLDPARVRLRAAHVTGGRRAERHVEQPSGHALEQGERLAQARLLAAADVEGRAGARVERPDRRADDIRDVREAARLAAVAVDLEGATAREGVDRARERHVGTLARPVDREVAEG